MDQSVVLDAALISRYDKAGPRYTSYPTAPQFSEEFTADRYRHHAHCSDPRSPLSLYFHLPFCATVCFYCACTKIITNNRKRAQPYLQRLHREIALQGELYKGRCVDQLHWGGGTPTFLSTAQMRELMQVTADHFQLRDDDQGEYSIEIDPREADEGTMQLLRELGFNRVSLGVQDFDAHVQRAVNRIQSEEQTARVLQAARDCGFRSTSVDLIYGLPLQSVRSFSATLDKIVAASPDRISVFNYAHLPRLFKTQKQIDEKQLPAPGEKLAILAHVIERLTGAGYVYIGMDHFARPDDELAIAQREGTLYRNFQGYATRASCDLVGMGMSAIGSVAECYSQNTRDIAAYCEDLDHDQLPIVRGVELSRDDHIRRDAITRLMCDFALQRQEFAARWEIDFDSYFARELNELLPMAEDGLVRLDDQAVEIQPAGRLLVRNVCMVFDSYLHAADGVQMYSRAI
jgi:oxygen-independent coproporphyrinogen-3 oxidase